MSSLNADQHLTLIPPPRTSLLKFTNKLVLPLTLFLLTLFILASSQHACALTQEGGVYQIATSADLIDFHNGLDSGTIPLSADALLTADIDLADADGKLMDWTPISGDYAGTFDGAGHSVKGYEITKTVGGNNYAGFFSIIDFGGVVRGLTVEGGVNITSLSTGSNVIAGAVAGWNYGIIESCQSTSTAAVIINVDITSSRAGGIAGHNNGKIIDCAAAGGVRAENSDMENTIGGISGWNNSGTITSCINDGPVAAKGDSYNYAGGIAGQNNGEIYNCANRVSISASASNKGDNQAGGIAGQSGGEIYNCANLGDVSVSADATADHQSSNAGGIVGKTSNSGILAIGSCANSGLVTLTVSGDVNSFHGGVLGGEGNAATIENCAWLKGTAEYGVGSDKNNTKTKMLDENAMKNAVTTLTAQTAERRITANGGSTTIMFITLPGTPVTYGNNVRNSRASTKSDIITIGKSEIDSSGKITVTAKNKTGDAAVALSADLYMSDFNHGDIIIPTPPLTYSFTRTIEVVEPIYVTGVQITSSKDITLEGADRTEQLSAHVLPENAKNKAIIWNTSSADVAVVDPYGKVTKKGPGSATIRAAAAESPDVFYADCNVSVTEAEMIGVRIFAKDGKTTPYVGEELNVNIIFAPRFPTNTELTWTIDDPSVLSLDKVVETDTGEIAIFKTLKAGPASIKARSVDNSSVSSNNLDITVLKPTVWVTGIKLSKEAVQLNSGEHEKLTATIYPAEASDKRVEWKSSDEKIASVSENGEVVAHNPGETVVTATALGTKEGTVVSADCLVTVTAPTVPVESVKISPEGTTLKIGDTLRFTANILPANADYKGVTWKSSDEKIAAVDANGGVTALAVGFATITVTTDDGLKTAEATVSVNKVYSSGSGCAAGVGALALFALIPLWMRRRKR